VAICLERSADLQLMPLPLTVSCFRKIQTGFTFLVPAHPGSPVQRAVKRVCGYVSNNGKLVKDSNMASIMVFKELVIPYLVSIR